MHINVLIHRHIQPKRIDHHAGLILLADFAAGVEQSCQALQRSAVELRFMISARLRSLRGAPRSSSSTFASVITCSAVACVVGSAPAGLTTACDA